MKTKKEIKEKIEELNEKEMEADVDLETAVRFHERKTALQWVLTKKGKK